MNSNAEGRQRATIEEIINRLRPAARELGWTSEGDTESHFLTITVEGKRIRLKFSQNALDATDDPANIAWFRLEVRNELRLSESGGRVGYVTWAS